MAAVNGSIKMVNNDGESGHTCLVPLCSVKLRDVSPLVMTVTGRTRREMYRSKCKALFKDSQTQAGLNTSKQI